MSWHASLSLPAWSPLNSNIRAATLFGLAEQAHSQIHYAISGPMRSLADAALATVKAALEPSVFAEAFAAGQQMSLEEAFATILVPTPIALKE